LAGIEQTASNDNNLWSAEQRIYCDMGVTDRALSNTFEILIVSNYPREKVRKYIYSNILNRYV